MSQDYFRTTPLAVCGLLLASIALAQSDRGAITGTVLDPAQAVVPNAKVRVRNVDTGAIQESISTPTGNYTIASLPAGTYELSVEAAGFTKHVRQGLHVQVALTSRVDVVLQVGSTTESVTVSTDAPLLKTETAEQSLLISRDNLNALPLNFGSGGGSMGGIRSPLNFIALTPGTTGIYNLTTGGFGASVNGVPGNNFQIIFEGQDTTSGNTADTAGYNQPSVDAIQEFSLQTSNFAAEFGRVGGGLFNFTARSGTNRYHGTAYEFFVNEALDANRPFVYYKPSSRKHDFGGTIGGPVWIPKVYDGHNRTFFFFFSYERFRNVVVGAGGSTAAGTVTNTFATVPTEIMRNGDFSQVLTGRSLGTDPAGRAILENAIYDPLTQTTLNGQIIRSVFPGNIVPQARFDPVALKIQALIPKPTNSERVNNFFQFAENRRIQAIPSIKIDHNITNASKLSFYWSRETTDLWAGVDGLPVPITRYRDQHLPSNTYRLNYDHTLTPTLLLHLGAGYIRFPLHDGSPPSVYNYDAQKELGFLGAARNPSGFPGVSGLSSSFGGMSLSMGTFGPTLRWNDKFTSTASANYIRGNHSYKLGGEFAMDMWINAQLATTSTGFSSAQTALPYLQTTSIGGGSIGFGYASFLMGAANSGSVANTRDPMDRKQSWGLYLQDTWKVTRKLTLDYGLRWDWQNQGHELHYRSSGFGTKVPNPSAGGLPGAVIYEGYGPGRCNCLLTDTYPYAVGPRIGAAYQADSKTVVRAGWGLVYNKVPGWAWGNAGANLGPGWNSISIATTNFGESPYRLRDGLQYNQADLYKVVLDPGVRPQAGQLNAPAFVIDRNAGRPARISQWSIGVQREVTKDLVVEAAYVGNRGAWLPAPSLINLNAIRPGFYQSLGLDITNAADRTLLTSTIGSAAAQARGFRLPYAGYPTGATVAQSLRPFPQFSSSLSPSSAPVGNSWYDSLQVKVSKRLSHGLQLGTAFTWAKALAQPPGNSATTSDLSGANDVFNRKNQKAISATDQPKVLAVNFSYEFPAFQRGHRALRALTGGWTFSGLVRYQSGLPIGSPGSTNNLSQVLFQSTVFNRVPGEPLFLKDLNCHCIDPNKEFVLNPKAWSDPAPGQWGSAALYYSDYRYARRPNEQFSLGKIFRIRESMSFHIRAEFFNVFNRTYLGNPSSGNPLQTQTRNALGVPTSGFGRIDATAVAGPPRNGQLVARLTW